MTAEKRQYNRDYYLAHRQSALVKAAAYREANRKLIAEKAIADYYKNRDRILAQKRIYTSRTKDQKRKYNQQYARWKPDKIKLLSKRYRTNNKEHIYLKNKLYRDKHPERHKASRNKWRANNPGNDRLLTEWRQCPKHIRDVAHLVMESAN